MKEAQNELNPLHFLSTPYMTDYQLKLYDAGSLFIHLWLIGLWYYAMTRYEDQY